MNAWRKRWLRKAIEPPGEEQLKKAGFYRIKPVFSVKHVRETVFGKCAGDFVFTH